MWGLPIVDVHRTALLFTPERIHTSADDDHPVLSSAAMKSLILVAVLAALAVCNDAAALQEPAFRANLY
ncbi:hypothetical protein HF086_014251, partial [Spodoptera exigua]